MQEEQVIKVRTFNWVPDCFVKKNEHGDEKILYTGHLVLKALKATERTRLQAECESMRTKDNEDTKANAEFMLGIFEKNQGMILESHVIRVSDEKQLSLEDLEYEEPLARLPMEFAVKFMTGFGLGNA